MKANEAMHTALKAFKTKMINEEGECPHDAEYGFQAGFMAASWTEDKEQGLGLGLEVAKSSEAISDMIKGKPAADEKTLERDFTASIKALCKWHGKETV